MSQIDAVDALLPQTQCGECDYPACRPYAEAIVRGEAEIERCAPGGVDTLHALASLLNRDPTPYENYVKEHTREPVRVSIREAECIGCTKCIQACPVDAIVGSAKQMHTIIQQECTGCRLCIAPCPVDCIDVTDVDSLQYDRDTAKARYTFRQYRLERLKQEREERRRQKQQLVSQQLQDEEKKAKQDYIAQAIKRRSR